MSGRTERKKIAYLEYLRIIACVLVVGVHVSAMCLEQENMAGINFKVMNGLDCLSILGVPLFVMISGALLLSEDYPDDRKRLYLHKIPRLVFLYFFWRLFYNTMIFVENNIAWGYENVKQEIVLNSLLGKGIYHLWFVPMLAVLYLITPFLKSFAADKKKCLWFCGLCFLYAVFFPTILKFEFPYRTIVESLYDQFPCSMFSGYVGIYMLGHVLHAYLSPIGKKWLTLPACLGIVMLGIEIYVCNLYSVKQGTLSTILNTPFSVNAYVAAACVFVIVKNLGLKENRVSGALSGLTLGVYLIHPFFLKLYQDFGGNTLFAPAILAIPAVTFSAVLLSMTAVFLISKIPILRKVV